MAAVQQQQRDEAMVHSRGARDRTNSGTRTRTGGRAAVGTESAFQGRGRAWPRQARARAGGVPQGRGRMRPGPVGAQPGKWRAKLRHDGLARGTSTPRDSKGKGGESVEGLTAEAHGGPTSD